MRLANSLYKEQKSDLEKHKKSLLRKKLAWSICCSSYYFSVFFYHASVSTALIRSCSEGNGFAVSDIFGLTSGKPGTGENMNF